jgi:hypothetical protein
MKKTKIMKMLWLALLSASPFAHAESGDAFSQNLPAIVIVAAIIGFIFWSSKKNSAGKCQGHHCSGGGHGETGVVRYLKKVAAEEAARKNETGVAKYLRLNGLS